MDEPARRNRAEPGHQQLRRTLDANLSAQQGRFAQNLLYYKGRAQPAPPSRPADGAGAIGPAIGPAPSPAAPRLGSGALAETPAAPDASHRVDPKAKATADVGAAALPQATAKSNRAPAQAATGSQPANAIPAPRRRIAAVQASTPAHRTERPTAFLVEPETRPTTVSGWLVRDVIGGTAVLEGPNGVRNVALGDVVPELGKVGSILRWGSRWIVSTERGLISTL